MATRNSKRPFRADPALPRDGDAPDVAHGIRPPLPPIKATWFHQEKGEPAVEHVIFALKGVCEALDLEQLDLGDWDQMCRVANLATAARILGDQLHDRMTSGPHRVRRSKPELRAVQDSEGTATAAAGRAH